MARRPNTDQLDLFAHPRDPKATGMLPPWQALPAQARLTLTRLMVRLILDHAAGDRAPDQKEQRHERLRRSDRTTWSVRRSSMCGSPRFIRSCTIARAAPCNMRCAIV